MHAQPKRYPIISIEDVYRNKGAHVSCTAESYSMYWLLHHLEHAADSPVTLLKVLEPFMIFPHQSVPLVLPGL